MAIDWTPLREIINNAGRFVISSHVRPDADAIGSELGLAFLLETLGKSVRIANPSATPRHLAFLDPNGRAQKLKEGISVAEVTDVDVHIVVDTSAWGQLPDVDQLLRKSNARKVVIDHHVSGDDLGALVLKDTSASATGVLITELAEYLGIRPTGPAADALFCAIATDTGWFRFSNTDARTLHWAARLIDDGARPNLLYRELYERSSPARLKLHSRVLGRVAFAVDGRLGYTYVLLQDYVETGAHPVDVARVAEQFGGGGHKQAAGATLDGPLANAQAAVLTAMQSALDESLAT
jgi:phosphoesterase RecJ-like protein